MNRKEQLEIQNTIADLAKKAQLLIGLSEGQARMIACIAYEYSLPNHGIWQGNT